MKNYLQGNITPHSLGCYTWMPYVYNNMQFIHYYFLELYRISTFPCTKNYSPNCIHMSQLSECLQKGYLPNTLLTSRKLQGILAEVKKLLHHTNPDYTLVLDRLHLYYDMQLVTFGIDKDMNLVIQFSVFIQPSHSETFNPISTRNSSSPGIGWKYWGSIIYTL